ncbi:MAG: NAD(P)-dependent oxidoreductase [Planctomycetota bacterium]
MLRRDRILLTGASGYFGRHVFAELRSAGLDVVTAGRRGQDLALDLTQVDSIRQAMVVARPNVVVHLAALSTMAACESDPTLAQRINADCVPELAESVERFWFVSTDLVFNGRAAPYRTKDPVSPLSAYARTKVFGEMHALALGGGVIRLPLLFGPSHDGKHGATDMIRHAITAGRSLDLFDDEFRTPLHVVDAARAVVGLCRDARGGLAHVAGPERVSRHELGLRFARAHELPSDGLRRAPSSDPLRPRDVSLVGDVPLSRDLDAMLRDS